MEGHSVPVLELAGALDAGPEDGLEARLEPHMVHGEMVTPKIADVVIEGVGFADDTHQDVIVYWHTCPRYLGAMPGCSGCTVYGRVQCVVVMTEPPAPAAALLFPSTAAGRALADVILTACERADAADAIAAWARAPQNEQVPA
jgi:hypothetical protein